MIFGKSIFVVAVCLILALATVLLSLQASTFEGSFLAWPTLAAIIGTSKNVHQPDPNIAVILVVLILNVLLVATVYYGAFHLLRWIDRKARGVQP